MSIVQFVHVEASLLTRPCRTEIGAVLLVFASFESGFVDLDESNVAVVRFG